MINIDIVKNQTEILGILIMYSYNLCKKPVKDQQLLVEDE